MLNYYLGLTPLISWWFSSGTFWTMTSLAAYFSGYRGDFKPLGFVVFNSLLVTSIGLALAHIIIKGLKIPKSAKIHPVYTIAMVISAALTTLPTLLSAYTLAFREYDLFIVDLLHIIASFAAIAVVFLMARQATCNTRTE